MPNVKDLLLKIESGDISYEEKLAALSQVEASLQELKAKKEERVKFNVQLIIDEIKKVKQDVQAQLDYARSIIPEQGPKGEAGERGLDGAPGRDGRDGVDGRDGKDGKDGQDGVSVTGAKIDFDGSLVITLSTGREINVGEVVAADLAEKIKVTMSTNSSVAIQDEGTTLTSGVRNINFTGTGVTATASGDSVTVNVSGGGGGGSGTVTSVDVSGGTTGLTTSGGPVTTSGTITLAGTLAVANGGTGATSAAAALTNLGAYPASNPSGYTSNTGTVTSVTGTSPVASSGGTTPAISLASGYGDTQNPYASKTANYVLASPNGSSGAPTFRAIVAADIPTLNNNRIDPRVSSTTSTSSITPDISSFDQYCVTAQAATLTINAPTGTPVNGNKLIFRILDNGTSQTLSWNGTFTAIGVSIPSVTTASKMTYVGCIYNAANTRWDVIAVATQA